MANLFRTVLSGLNLMKPRFHFSDAHPDCREKTTNAGRGHDMIVIRLQVENFGWRQRHPPPCEVLLKQVIHAADDRRSQLTQSPARLTWKENGRVDGLTIPPSRLVNICHVELGTSPAIEVRSDGTAALHR